ncbi:MAG: hypothetical protein WD068_03425 [Candidatus Babeliales bacterium]
MIKKIILLILCANHAVYAGSWWKNIPGWKSLPRIGTSELMIGVGTIASIMLCLHARNSWYKNIADKNQALNAAQVLQEKLTVALQTLAQYNNAYTARQAAYAEELSALMQKINYLEDVVEKTNEWYALEPVRHALVQAKTLSLIDELLDTCFINENFHENPLLEIINTTVDIYITKTQKMLDKLAQQSLINQINKKGQLS